MKNWLKILIVLIVGLILISSNQDALYYKYNKAFEIFGAVVREISENYIVETDPEELFRNAIDGMLSDLDPYTNYYPEDDRDDIDMVTNGHYVGFGITIRRIDSRVTVSDFSHDFRAFEDGLRIGDVIYSIDDQVTERMKTDSLRRLTNGKANSKSKLKVLRGNNFQDTVTLTLSRQKVSTNNVVWSGILESNIGLIKLQNFSRSASVDFAKSLRNLKNKSKKSSGGKLNGLIIDLRDNPGGLLSEAVNIAGHFLPKNSLIVNTKGRKTANDYSYISRNSPDSENLPLCILINERSASASEILAAAFQDYDRALILGRQSFGKGLVQSVLNLPFNSSIKITSSKYFTPSGRSLQRIDYFNGGKVATDTNIFHTSNGRQILEHIGVTPDSVIGKKIYTNYILDISKNNYFFTFANEFCYGKKNIEIDFSADDSLASQFSDYLKEDSYVWTSSALKDIENLYMKADEILQFDKAATHLDSLHSIFSDYHSAVFTENKKAIKELLEREIIRRYHNKMEMAGRSVETDSLVRITQSIFASDKLSLMLSTPSEKKEKLD
jgi:carboxyl-terminal processing protease